MASHAAVGSGSSGDSDDEGEVGGAAEAVVEYSSDSSLDDEAGAQPAQPAAAAAQPTTRAPARRGVTKSKIKPTRRASVTDTIESNAEKLLSAEARGLIKFEKIPPTAGMAIGGVGVGPGDKGGAAFGAYIRQPAVVDRLQAEGFVRSGGGAPHPWHLVKGTGIVLPADKVLCRSLTPGQREKIESNRRRAIARRGADIRPCGLCGHGDDAGTVIHCDHCNLPFHDGCAGAPPVAGDWFCAACK